MFRVAVKMLLGDYVKYAGLLFGIAFTSFLVTFAGSYFAGFMTNGFALISENPRTDVWVMDPAVRSVEPTTNMPFSALDRVRSVEGVARRMSVNVQSGGGLDDQTAHAPSTGRSLCFFKRRSTVDNDLNAIRDSRFTNQFAILTSLKTFLLMRGVHIREEDVTLLLFGKLNDLQYNEKGRLPTADEWEQLDKRLQKLFSYLDLRKHFELSQAANLIAQLPLLLIFVALLIVALSLITVIFAVGRLLLLGCYFLWTALLGAIGAIGAIAFLSMNTLSIQKDITFDLTNKSLLAVRICSETAKLDRFWLEFSAVILSAGGAENDESLEIFGRPEGVHSQAGC